MPMENKIAEALKVERSTVTKLFIAGMPHLDALCPVQATTALKTEVAPSVALEPQ